MLGGWALQGYVAVGHCRDTLQGDSSIGHCRDTLRLGMLPTSTARILGGWALQGYSAVGHCRDTLRMSAARILCGWALQGYSAIGRCPANTRWLGIAGILCGWALQGYSAVGHCRDTLPLSTAGILSGWALQGYLVVGHCRDTWWLGLSRMHCHSALQSHHVSVDGRGDLAAQRLGDAVKLSLAAAVLRNVRRCTAAGCRPPLAAGSCRGLRARLAEAQQDSLFLARSFLPQCDVRKRM